MRDARCHCGAHADAGTSPVGTPVCGRCLKRRVRWIRANMDDWLAAETARAWERWLTLTPEQRAEEARSMEQRARELSDLLGASEKGRALKAALGEG